MLKNELINNRKNYITLDIAKFICAIIILLYHWGVEWGTLPWVIDQMLSLYAVVLPIFMAISGFLFFTKINATNPHEHKSVLKHHVKRSLSVYLIWSVGYIIYQIYRWNIKGLGISAILKSIWGWISYSTFYTIWFIPAQVIGIILVYFLYKKIGMKRTLFVTAILYLIGTLGLTYDFVLEKSDTFTSLLEWYEYWFSSTRNGVFYAPVFVSIGAVMANSKRYLKISQSAIGVICAMIVLLCEAILLKKHYGDTGVDMALLLPVVTYFVMNFVLVFEVSVVKESAAVFMRRISVLMFLAQRYFLTVLPDFSSEATIGLLQSSNLISFTYVVGGTMLLSLLIIILSYRIRILRKLY